MIRRFLPAQIVPAKAGARVRTHWIYSHDGPTILPKYFCRNANLRQKYHGLVRKGLKGRNREAIPPRGKPDAAQPTRRRSATEHAFHSRGSATADGELTGKKIRRRRENRECIRKRSIGALRQRARLGQALAHRLPASLLGRASRFGAIGEAALRKTLRKRLATLFPIILGGSLCGCAPAQPGAPYSSAPRLPYAACGDMTTLRAN